MLVNKILEALYRLCGKYCPSPFLSPPPSRGRSPRLFDPLHRIADRGHRDARQLRGLRDVCGPSNLQGHRVSPSPLGVCDGHWGCTLGRGGRPLDRDVRRTTGRVVDNAVTDKGCLPQPPHVPPQYSVNNSIVHRPFHQNGAKQCETETGISSSDLPFIFLKTGINARPYK